MSLIVMTFGAAALQDSDSLLTIGEALRQSKQTGNSVIAVIDALPGVTELLGQSIELGNYSRAYNKLHSIHSNTARKLIREERDRAILLQDIDDILGSYQWLGRSIVHRSPTPAEAATMLATGERLSARLLAAYLQHRSVQASTLNGHELLVTDDDPLSATPDLERSHQRCSDQIMPLVASDYLMIVGSSGGGNEDGRPTRLAGDSLHLTASLLAVFCQASGLWMMGQGDGILSADPDYVTNAQTIPVLSMSNLIDLADYGSEMPPASALKPAIDARIPVFIRSVSQPTHPGTYIHPEMTGIGPIVVQKVIGTIHASGLEREAGLKALFDNGIAAVMSNDDLTFLVHQDDLNSAHLTLSRLFPAVDLSAKNEATALVTVLNFDGSTHNHQREDIQTALRNAGIESPKIMSTIGHSGNTSLSTLLPSDRIEIAVNEIHSLIFNS